MKFEGPSFMNTNETNTNEQEVLSVEKEVKTTERELADASIDRLELDSTLPTGERAKEVIANFREGIARIPDPIARFNAYLQLAMYAKKVGEKEMRQEILDLAHAAEKEYSDNVTPDGQESLEYIKTIMNDYLAGKEITARMPGKVIEMNPHVDQVERDTQNSEEKAA